MLMMPCCHPCCKPTLLANQKAPASSVDDVLLEDPAHAAVALLAAHALRDTAAAAVAPVGMYARQIPRPSPSAARGTCLFQCTGGTTQCGTALAPFCTDTTTDNLNCGAAPLACWRATSAAGLLARKATHATPVHQQGSANQLLALCIDMTTNSSGVGRSRTRV